MPVSHSLQLCATWMGLWAFVFTCQAIEPLVTVGKPALRDVEYSPGGRWLVVATEIDVRLLDPDDYAAQAVISAGADQIAVIELWDPTGPTKLLTLDSRGHLAFCSDGRYLAHALDNTVRLYDVVTGEIARRYFGTRVFGVSSNRPIIATENIHGLEIWTTDSGAWITRVVLPDAPELVRFSRDGKWIACTTRSSPYISRRMESC